MTWPFLIFAVLFGCALVLHFAFGLRELQALKREQPVEIDWRFVQFEDYFGRSFRQKLAEWLKLPKVGDAENGDSLIVKGSERIRVTRPVTYTPHTTVGEILAVDGDLACGARCTFTREVYVSGDCSIEGNCEMQALAVDGDLSLGPSSTVVRWADATGRLSLGERCRVRAPATSRTAIHMGPGAEARSLFAPEIATAGRRDSAATARPLLDEMFTMPPTTPMAEPGPQRKGGCDARKLFRVTPECWVYRGNLHVSAPLHLTGKLIVKGNFSCPPDSVLEADIKASGFLHVGDRSVCKANLVATGDIVLGPDTRFEGVVHAGRTLQLCRGVRGKRDDGLVAAYAVQRVYVATNVVVCGKLGAGDRVIALPGAADAAAGVEDMEMAAAS